MTLEEVFAATGKTGPNGERILEAWLSAECPNCGKEVALESMERREKGQQTEYVCNCGGVPLRLGPHETDPPLRLKTYYLRGQADRVYAIQPEVRVNIDLPGGRIVMDATGFASA